MSEKILEIKNLVVEFNTQGGVSHALNGVSLSVDPGKTLGLVGETGAGKTTTALSTMRLLPEPEGKIVSGEIYFDGQNVMEMGKKDLRRMRGNEISMIFQDPMTALNPLMRVRDQIAENIKLHQSLSAADAVIKANETLEMVGIPASRSLDYPHQFSGGMKQRVVIAMALTCNPKLLLADEPTTALDVTIQAQILDIIRSLRDKLGTSLLLITHDLGIVAEMCDDVAVMYAGEVIESGEIHQIFKNRRHPYTEGLFRSIPNLTSKVSRLQPIAGLMPDPMDLPSGCYFSPRCPYASEECRRRHPAMTEVEPGHLVRCHKCMEVKADE